MSPSKILIVDDFEPFRRLVCSMLEQKEEFQIIGQASDGLEALQKAAELRPDLILLDIGLPKLNGIEAARRVRKLAPDVRILFFSQYSSSDVVQEALRVGALGYVHKQHSRSELLPAIEAVLAGKRFVSSSLKGWESSESTTVPAPHRHDVQFYSDDAFLIEHFARFITTALRAGNPAIVVATGSHLDRLYGALRAEGLDVDGASQQGTYITADAADTLSTIMVNGLPDPIRLFEGFTGLIERACKAAKAEHPRVAICGEGVGLLWTEGRADAAIRLEQLCNDLCEKHDLDMLCAYPTNGIYSEEQEGALKRICAEHSAVRSQC